MLLLFLLIISITPNEAARFLNDINRGKEVEFLNGNKHLLLPSLQWNPVRPPTPNPGTNSRTNLTSQVAQRNFAGRKEFAPPPPSPSNNYSQLKVAFSVAMD